MRSEQAPIIKEEQAKNTKVPEDQEVKKSSLISVSLH